MKVLGIPTKIDPSFFVLSLFLAASRGSNLTLLLEWLVVVFISVLFHELGHALVARRFGLSPQITLYSMGGLTSWSDDKEIAPPKHLAISLAGPAAGFLLGGVIFVAAPMFIGTAPSEILVVAYNDLLWVNIGWGIFNLLPILPLDGGHVLLTLERWFTRKQDQIISYTISLLASLAITGLALLTLRSVWIAILGLWFAYSNGTYLLQRIKTSRDKKLEAKLQQAREKIDAEDFQAAQDIIFEIKKKAVSSWMRSEASRLLIFILIKQDRLKEADEELLKFNGLFGSDHYLQGLLNLKSGQMSRAIPDLKKAFDESPDYQVGLILSEALRAEKRYAEGLELCGHPVMTEAVWPISVNIQSDAFENQQFEISGRAGALAFEQKRDPNIAYNTACAYARNSDSTQALVWLEKAIASGFSDKNHLATDPDLQSIRSQPGFVALFERMTGHP